MIFVLSLGKRLEEVKYINTSLTTLERCIHALSASSSLTSKANPYLAPIQKKRKISFDHVPYRESELTKLLAESLGGNSMTTVLVTCRTDGDHVEETLSTLRFGICSS